MLDTTRDSSGRLSREELDDVKQQVDEVQRAFNKEHAHFEVVWPSSMLDHPYFNDRCYLQMQLVCLEVKTLIVKKNATLQAQQSDVQVVQSRLPVLELPKFTGNYTDWLSFFDLFSSMILNTSHLKDVEKFYYLKRCLRGEPARMISNLPLTGALLQPAIEQLKNRYGNKRQLVQAHLDKLTSMPMNSNQSSRLLSKLISTAIETRNALLKLVDPSMLGDCMLVHQVCRRVDRTTREKWEFSLETATDYPTFEQLDQFGISRIWTLEMLKSNQARSAHDSYW
ncbi:uncharacterized protein LOC117603275 [Osmia lignaria lignaria]|uniref:uncharacterized protein LOC117603275 n=1 Tax=Osmia lignaria lignaria TaxID=1437193 RepID=UPI0014796171|nr:uncharacterized protein LOC117603275 [Osmia lignaria]